MIDWIECYYIYSQSLGIRYDSIDKKSQVFFHTACSGRLKFFPARHNALEHIILNAELPIDHWDFILVKQICSGNCSHGS